MPSVDSSILRANYFLRQSFQPPDAHLIDLAGNVLRVENFFSVAG
jgi:hypothetical protein